MSSPCCSKRMPRRANWAGILERNVADRQLRTGHGCQADEAADLDHVGQQRVFGAVQLPDTLDGEQVRGDARDACAHAVEHQAQLLDVRFARGVVDGRETLGHHSRHDDIGRAGHRSLVEQHVAPLEFLAADFGAGGRSVEIERGAQLLKADEVGVEPAAADLVAARLGHVAHAETRQHRTQQHHRTPEAAGPAAVVVRA